MKTFTAIAFIVSLFALAAQADTQTPASSTFKSVVNTKRVCKKGEVGGIVASNKKLADGSYRTIYVGDKIPFNTPVDAKDLIAKVAKLKVGDKNCIVDDGS
jgi:hypothetical protein